MPPHGWLPAQSGADDSVELDDLQRARFQPGGTATSTTQLSVIERVISCSVSTWDIAMSVRLLAVCCAMRGAPCNLGATRVAGVLLKQLG